MHLKFLPFVLSSSKDSATTHQQPAARIPILSTVLAFLLCALTILTAPREPNAQEQILVGYDGHAGFQGAIWATKDLGLFEKHGLSG